MLSQARYHAITHTDAEPVTVTVTLADQLVAEKEAPRHGITAEAHAPMHTTALWVWCALRRGGAGVGTFREWVDAGGDFEPVMEAPAPVDPTQPADCTPAC